MLNNVETGISKRRLKGRVYDAIIEAATLGDPVFFISETENSSEFPVYRRWVGLCKEDNTNWHTSIYVGPVKDPKGSQLRPHIVHSADAEGTEEIHIPHTYFSDQKREGGKVQKCRIEILHNPDISDEERKKIVEYARRQVKKPFDDLGWKQDWPTYVLGLRSRLRDPNKVSCHGLAFDAYGLVGLSFPHQLRGAPNIVGRVLGHPLGHLANKVDLRYPYLRDHHLYRDPRFQCVLAVYGGPELENVETKLCPGKYSWNPRLKKVYGV